MGLDTGAATKIGAKGVTGFLLRQGAKRSFEGASKFISKSTLGFAKTGGKSGRTTFQSFGNGGEKGANKLFDTLTKGKSEALDGGGRLGSLKDGSRVQISTTKGVTSVRITQKVSQPGSRLKRTNTIKVRFKDDK